MVEIPVFQSVSADFRQQIELDNQIVELRIVYNVRTDFFFLTFTDQAGGTVTGIKIVPNWPLLDNKKAYLDFNGDMLIMKVDDEAENEITYNNLGTGWALFYLTADEVQEWKVLNGFQ